MILALPPILLGDYLEINLKDLSEYVIRTLKFKKAWEAAAKKAVKSVQKRTRSGKGVKLNEGPTHKLPQLKDKTVKERIRLQSQGRLKGPGARPEKSGLNRTGDLLGGVKYTAKEGEAILKLADSDEERKADELIDLDSDYEFFNLSKQEVEEFTKEIEKTVDDELKKLSKIKL